MHSETSWGLNQILDRIDVGIVVLDLQHANIEYSNPAFYHVVGDQSICDDFEALYNTFLRSDGQTLSSMLTGTITGSVELENKYLGFSIYQIDKKYCCVFIRDITERRRLEGVAQAANSVDNLGFVFSGIRHELGNPLNSLKMTLSVLKQNLNRFPEQTVLKYIDRSLADIGRMEYLLQSLKNFSMFEVVHLTKVSLFNFIKAFQSLVYMDLENRGIVLGVEAPGEDMYVRIDPRSMNQVLLNIVSNAADALAGVEVPQILIRMMLKEERPCLFVRDNGCGIPPDQIKRLFQPFSSSKPGGSGLGLVITKRLLTLMGCDIEIESQVGTGTCVTIGLAMA
ncbi:MAG: hypothetical protein CSA33_04490 [Desulfobulbus propionicus]|nr:MAG: hypothetical protein CSA33_04490 [Desulfobulbus propionicus]